MSTSDDQPTVIIEKESGSEIGAFLLGAVVGAGLALLFAPQSGQETQEQIRERARRLREVTEGRVRELRDATGERVRDLREATEDRVRGIRDEVGNQLDSVKGAVEQGKQAATDARVDLEDRLARTKAAYRAGLEAATSEGEPAEDS